MVSAQARREQAHYAIGRGLTQRRACALLQVSRSTLGYELKMPIKNAPVIEAIRNLRMIPSRVSTITALKSLAMSIAIQDA